MAWDDDFSDEGSNGLEGIAQDSSPVGAPFWILWSLLGVNSAVVLISYIFRPSSLDAALWLGIYWLVSFLLLVGGYYVFSVRTQTRKLNPNYGTPPSSETRSRLIFLAASFLVTCFAAYPLAYELSRIVRF